MEGIHDKNAFYVVKKGDLVGVYKNLNDCLSVVGSSGSSPPVTVYKGYNLQGQTEDYLKSYGLSNALYCIDAASFDRINTGQLIPFLPQQPIPSQGTSSGYSSSSQIKRPADAHWPEADVNGLVIASSLNHPSKHVKLDCSFPSQGISPGYRSCTLEFDGAAKRNPGPAGAGAILRSEDGSVVFRLREGVGIATNNAAEYRALILGLNYALEKGYQHIRVRGDSMLVCMQLQGLWKTKSENMAKFCKVAKELKEKFVSFQINHVLREFNAEADAQANKAISLRDGEIEVDCIRK
ncbi:hypothetical protein MLD38_024481 [Melastoma candidum]|uniref:Uncharacterized protein n=1 Tax=Melastoma candidum TaxID=119954 RepID=A0ACB9NVT4_9MYRT|nr:hypothetical protein MLD38_024481 [Melastoma candidum]